MSTLHLKHWPPHAPHHLWVPQTHLYRNLEVSAERFPAKPFIVFYDTVIDYARFRRETEWIAGWLQQRCGVQRGDRVLLYMQNSPQFMTAFYGILRADAVVVPVNPMNLTEELRHLAADSGARVAFVAQDLWPRAAPLLAADGAAGRIPGALDHVIVAAYSDYLEQRTDLDVPEFVAARRVPVTEPGAVAWADVLDARLAPAPLAGGPDDLAVMPYTSGTTGQPKGCMHTHRSTMYNAVANNVWAQGSQGTVALAVLPMFHVTGMQHNLNASIYAGATVVVLPRWDRDAAARLVQRYRVTSMSLITAMAIDFVSNPRLADFDLSSLRTIGGGGAAMPEAIARALEEKTGLRYREGYGMTETMAATHSNPPHRPKRQCLGVPLFDVDARVVDPRTLAPLPPGETGEILVHGPQLMTGYWNRPGDTAEAFVQIDGKRFLRTGDLAYVDDEGYFFFVDRLKRMINAAGFKVWPAEVEALLHHHPAVHEACVIAARDPRRGETVKAVVVLKDGWAGKVDAKDIIDWSHEHMAAYKVPRIVDFVASLPKSGSGKVMWRTLQEAENAR